jgi:hypothetical protein
MVSDKKIRTIFPSKADLSRLSKIKDIPIAHKACFLHFEEWKQDNTSIWCFAHLSSLPAGPWHHTPQSEQLDVTL